MKPLSEHDGENNAAEAVFSRRSLAAGLLTGALTFLYLIPILSAGLSNSDVAYGNLRAFGTYEHLGLLEALRVVSAQRASEHGGWLPLAMLQPALWLLFADPVVSKTLQLIFVAANVATMATLTATLARSFGFGTFVGIGTLLALELRKSHDPLLSDTFHYPLVFQLTLLALCAYTLYCVTRKGGWFVVSFAINLMACAVDESAWLLVLAFPIVALVYRHQRLSGWTMLLAPASIIAGMVALHFRCPASLRWLAENPYNGISISAKQILGMLPTSYRAFGNVLNDGVPGYSADSRFDAIPPIGGLGWVAALAMASTVYLATVRKPAILERRRIVGLTAFAVLLLVASALLHDPLQWTHGLPLGEAFSSVYLGYFAFGLFFAVGAQALSKHSAIAPSRAIAPVAVSLCAFILCYGNVRVNTRVIGIQRSAYETVSLIGAAGHRGVFSSVPDGAVVTFDPSAASSATFGSGFRDVKYLLYSASGRRMQVVDRRMVRLAGALRKVWVIRREFGGPLRGGLTIARVAGFAGRQYTIDRALAFRRYPAAAQRDQVIAELRSAHDGLEIVSVDTPGNELVADVSRSCRPVPIEHAYDSNDARWSYGPGFFKPSMYKRWNFWVTYFLTGSFTSDQPWRYASAHSEIIVVNPGCAREPLRFTAYAFSAAPGILKITTPGSRRLLRISSGGANIDMILPPAQRGRIAIRLDVDAPAAHEELGMPHFLRDERGPARLVLANPSISVATLSLHV